ncbi:electron donor-dependent reductase [Tribonema minus]|uniref:Thioredoxin reductase n=1 Tax=Tribonema minus TaxID=303371 RepID=A0A835YZJ1_9STRA|nr:electron donor-dependent reductase [Tribonema minus]
MVADGGETYDYDLVVIGGGSGGLATAKKAANYGAKVALFDFVKPSPQNTKWGLGGTCVNVGCVPKKLMHYAGLMGPAMRDAKNYGWQLPEDTPGFNWSTLVEVVQNHVKMLNFRYRVGLKSAQVTYINALARLASPHEIVYERRGVEHKVTAGKVVIAVGGRPAYPAGVPGAKEYAITSDDIFSLDHSPGKTLVVGASYIALECAGFLTELGFDTTVAVRSILLRGFDRQSAEKIGEVMEASGTRFVKGAVPSSIEKQADGKLKVTLVDSTTGAHVMTETFDTVMYGTGRTPDTAALNLEAAGVTVLPNGKIPVNGDESTNVPNIYALGDCAMVDVNFMESHWANPELTPVAIMAGQLLAARLYGKGTDKMDYTLIATAVFTPTEYGAVGLSEEDALKMFGPQDVEVYLQEFSSLELQATKDVSHKDLDEENDMPPMCLSKLVCRKSEGERVVGFHFVGPNAGELTQGFALALKLGAKKADFDKLVGIHPTDAEAFCGLEITRSSGIDFVAAGGCGGGTCG